MAKAYGEREEETKEKKQAKNMITKEQVEVMYAYYFNGAEIEMRSRNVDAVWCDMPKLDYISPFWEFNWDDFIYRIKPEEAYISYTLNTFAAAVKDGKLFVIGPTYPEHRLAISGFDDVGVCLMDYVNQPHDDKIRVVLEAKHVMYKELLDNYTWADGSKCGTKKDN